MGPATTHRNSPIDARRYAIEMLGKGYADVMIVDLPENGKAYAPAEFREFYLDPNKQYLPGTKPGGTVAKMLLFQLHQQG
jgi:hypothetical protein